MLALAELCGVRSEINVEAVSLVQGVLVWRVQLRAPWGSWAAFNEELINAVESAGSHHYTNKCCRE